MEVTRKIDFGAKGSIFFESFIFFCYKLFFTFVIIFLELRGIEPLTS